MAVVLLSLGYFLIWPVLLLLINSFNAASDWFVEPRTWGIKHWVNAFQRPGLLASLGNSLLIWSLTVSVSFPIGVAIAWFLARTKIPYSHTLEFLFWVSYMVPSLPTTIAWITLLDPDVGMINVALKKLFQLDQGPFNIFSVPGIVWANLMGHGISIKVMLLTPAFRNMDATLEEAARVGGAGNLRTLFRVTLPLMIAPMVMVFALQLLRVFQSFETEYLLGLPFGFFVYSTKIFALIRNQVPNYGEATVLASITLIMIAMIIPLQRWILERRRYTTITGNFRPGLIDLRAWNYVAFTVIALLLIFLTVGPLAILALGSFMQRIGYFVLGFTLDHWRFVLTDPVFVKALRTTLVLAGSAAIMSPLLFSVIAYVLVRTRLPGRVALDAMIWSAGSPVGVHRHAALEFLVRHYLGIDHRRDASRQNYRRQYYERRVRPGRRRYGGSRARFRCGVDQDLFPYLAAAVDADFNSFIGDEFRQRRRRNQQHYFARLPRHHDAFTDGTRVVLDRCQQSRGRQHYQHLHHRFHHDGGSAYPILRPAPRRAP
jgi:iron(III) transport system permease protein